MTARARWIAAFGAYLCLATHLVGVLHVLVVRHATCPGHGEVVHGAAPVVAEVPVLPGRVARNAPEPAEEADEHCLLMATRRRELAGLAPAPQPAVRAPAALPLDSSPVVAAVTPRALLRFAPKTSPPSIA
jgi:hypothetical protein